MPGDSPVLSGTEAWSAVGSNGCGALVLHGFTGNPRSMRSLAEAMASAGFSVELPLLPGHGTHVDDMVPTRWDDWFRHVASTYADLAARTDRVVVLGLSMGGTLATALALAHPEIAGLVLVNAAVEPMAQEFRDLLTQMAEVAEVMPAIGNDIALPGVTEGAYDATPLRALLSLGDAGVAMAPRLSEITMPCLLLNSAQDHVVAPTAAEFFASRVAGPVERITLEKSFHVATMDFDAELIEQKSVEFAHRVCGLS